MSRLTKTTAKKPVTPGSNTATSADMMLRKITQYLAIAFVILFLLVGYCTWRVLTLKIPQPVQVYSEVNETENAITFGAENLRRMLLGGDGNYAILKSNLVDTTGLTTTIGGYGIKSITDSHIDKYLIPGGSKWTINYVVDEFIPGDATSMEYTYTATIVSSNEGGMKLLGLPYHSNPSTDKVRVKTGYTPGVIPLDSSLASTATGFIEGWYLKSKYENKDWRGYVKSTYRSHIQDVVTPASKVIPLAIWSTQTTFTGTKALKPNDEIYIIVRVEMFSSNIAFTVSDIPLKMQMIDVDHFLVSGIGYDDNSIYATHYR